LGDAPPRRISVPWESPDAAEGVVVKLSLGFGPLLISAPCRVVYVVDAEREGGFAYGTLPGHPESGEERFSVLWREEDDAVLLCIRAFSRPANLLARLSGPVGHLVQERITTRYLRALAASA